MVGAAIFFNLCIYADDPVTIPGGQKSLTIKPGQDFKSAAMMMSREGIIKEPFLFIWLAFLKGYDKKIKAGEYLFSSQTTPNRVLNDLVKGKTIFYKLTIPEGYDMRMIASAAANAGFGAEDEFMDLVRDEVLAGEMGIEAGTFEGYLFPDTYFFSKGTSSADVVTAMVDRFQSVFSQAFRRRAESLGLSVNQVVTLASIIEKETGAAFERPIISSVFHNRLKRNMRLESDPTVIYGIKDFDGNITRKHLKEATPYNTYAIAGLPPGPIASPGLKSIEAALYPADTKFLFFVSKNDGSHIFSPTFEEHNQAVLKYQKRRLP